jgi:Bax protein
MAIKLWKKIPLNIRRWIIGILFSFVSILSAFAVGTMYPNKWVLNEFEKNITHQIQEEWKQYGFFEPEMVYNDNQTFIQAVNKCISYVNLTTPPMERVPSEIIVAMAILETGYGKSRFALQGNNLFGIRTWNKDDAQLKPKDNPDVEWGVKTYITKCQSVKDMVRIINNYHAYDGFRNKRAEQFESGQIDIFALIDELSKWSTNPKYTILVKSKAKEAQNLISPN